VLAGLEASKRYHLHYEDGSMPDREETGADLMAAGLLVQLKEINSSELVFVEEVMRE
jgi:hypothetical protein